MLHGRCHCGAIQFGMPDQVAHSAICYCSDCRKQSGAPMVAWAMVRADQVVVRGEPRVYASSETGRRSFCAACGAGLFFKNAILEQMGMMQVRIAALDAPDAVAPKVQVHTAERINWVASAHELPAFERFPK
jgi:hypothetical protein